VGRVAQVTSSAQRAMDHRLLVSQWFLVAGAA
jgi:hypothetical protein